MLPLLFLLLILFFSNFHALAVYASHEGQISPSETLSASAMSSVEIDRAVEKAIAEGNTPGAVLLVGHKEKVILSKAYGNRSIEPAIEPMTLDTLFDLASLTKVVATAPAILLLVQQGKVKLEDPAAKYLPAFAQSGKGKITVRQLMIHYSGLPADLRLSKRRKISSKNLLNKIYQVKPVARPGERFLYSDLGFIVLGKVVERVSGMTLDRFAEKHIFSPLGMTSTFFLPPREEMYRIAPTERRKDGGMMRGQVHDPLASKLGGVAGDAGLFSTAQDLSRFCQMYLNHGMLGGIKILKPEIVAQMTSPQTPEGKADIRGLGWDIQSRYSSVKGDFFSLHSYGHTGYTGTSLWLDPDTQTFLIILTNRVHPNGKGNVKELRSAVANLVGASVQSGMQPSLPIGTKASLSKEPEQSSPSQYP